MSKCKVEVDRLKEIQKLYPELTFINDGYEYIHPNIREAHKDQIREISEILNKLVRGFVVFNNFQPGRVRVQYEWTPMFTGVGYFTFEELAAGYDDDNTCNE